MMKASYFFILLAFFTASQTHTVFAHENGDKVHESEHEILKESKERQLAERKASIEARIKEQKLKFEDRKASLEARKSERKEKVEQKREELKEKLENIKDERKQKIVENIDTKLDAMNERATEHFLQVLVRLEEIVIKLQPKVDTTAATAAINTAKTNVAAQAAKEYTPNVSNEDTLRQTVGSTVSALRSDLKVTYETVKTARDAVKKAAQAARALQVEQPSNGSEPTATSAATQ